MDNKTIVRTRASKDIKTNLASTLQRLENENSELRSSKNIHYNTSEADIAQNNLTRQKEMSDFLSTVKKEQEKNNTAAPQQENRVPVPDDNTDPALKEMELPDSTEEVTEDPLGTLNELIANKVEESSKLEDIAVKPMEEEKAEEKPAPVKTEEEVKQEEANKKVEAVEKYVEKNTMPSDETIRQKEFNKAVEANRTVQVEAPKKEEQAPIQKEKSEVVKPITDEEEVNSETHTADEKEKEEYIDCQSLIGDDIKIGKVLRKKTADEVDLSDIEVDLNNIQVTQSPNLIHISSYMDNTFRPKSATQVVCMRSGYVAQMTDLNFADRDVLTGSADPVNYNRRKFKVIYNKIGGSSIGRMTFEEFLKVTAFSEIEILEYGIYAQTFPGKNSFDVTCNHCRTVTKVAVEPGELVQMVNAKANFLKIQEILKSQVSKPLEILNMSMLRNRERILLPDCKAVVEVITPSCEDYLDHLSKYDQNTMQDANETFGVMLYVGRIFVPNIIILKKTGKLAFDEISSKDFNQKFKIISNLTNKDGALLTKTINERESLYTVQHRLRGVTCQNCRRDLGSINIDLESLLFFSLRQQTQAEDNS